MSGQPYDASFFESHGERSLQSARVVLGRVFPLLQPRRVLDVGCGTGAWLRAALDLGAAEVLGTDGAYVDRDALLIDRDRFLPADLAVQSLPDVLGPRAADRFDLVICMEVVEHLPHARAPSIVAELTALTDVVLFSAAVPFQYGTSHVNEQWPEYWSILFRAAGFDCFDPLRAELWNEPDVEWWYAQNALLFARRGSAACAALPAASRPGQRGLALVHPSNLLSNLLGLPRRYRLHASQEEAQDLRSLVEANRRSDTVLPALAGPARAAAAAPDARDVFPWTRSEIYQPEQEVAEARQSLLDRERAGVELSRQLIETGGWLRAANDAFAAERQARMVAEARARDVDHYRAKSQALAAAKLQADMAVAELKAQEAELRQQLDASLLAQSAQTEANHHGLQAELDRHITEILRRSPVRRVARRARSIGVGVARRALGQRPMPASGAEEAQAPPDKPQIKRYEQVVGEVNWWTLAAAITRLKRLEVFDAEDYLRRNADVAAAGIDPYAHFIQSGALEGRGHVDREDLARLMSGLALFDHAVRALPAEEHGNGDLASLVADVNHIGLCVSSHGNVFMEDLANDLAADLRSVGVRVDILDETSDVDARPPTCLFVAPHEFFTLGKGFNWVRDDVLSDGFMFGTEQVQTTWFNLSLPFILMSRGIIDICPQTAGLFERLDMAALHLLPGVRSKPYPLTERDRRHPLYRVLPMAARDDIDPALPFAARPIDVSFFGNSSPRRDEFFARNAAFFANYETFNYNRQAARGPIRSEGEDAALTRLAGHVAGHSKITLNIHREDFSYFEWHRMVRLGMCSGSLVVSDPCLPHPDFLANEHYLQENARNIPDLLEWLLETEDGAREAERVRSNVNTLIGNSFQTNDTVAGMLRFLAKHRSRERG